MKTSLKKAMKCFLKSLPGISYSLNSKWKLVCLFFRRGLSMVVCPGVYVRGLCPDTIGGK